MSGNDPPAQKYQVRAVRWARGWELHVADVTGAAVGVTQVRRLSGAEAMVRDYLALDTGRDPESFIVQITPEVPGGLSEEIAAIRAEQQAVAARQADLAAHARAVARRLQEAGLTGSEVGAVMGVSEQRVSQLLRDAG
jgi:DNA-directed RNA polymerase specialized sigma24 family protein